MFEAKPPLTGLLPTELPGLPSHHHASSLIGRSKSITISRTPRSISFAANASDTSAGVLPSTTNRTLVGRCERNPASSASASRKSQLGCHQRCGSEEFDGSTRGGRRPRKPEPHRTSLRALSYLNSSVEHARTTSPTSKPAPASTTVHAPLEYSASSVNGSG